MPGIVRRVTTPVPGSLRMQAPAGAHRTVTKTGEEGARRASGSAGAAGWRVLGGADHVESARFELGGNDSFIVLQGVDLDIAVDRTSGRLGGHTR